MKANPKYAATRKAWRDRNKDKIRAYYTERNRELHFRNRYGIGAADYEVLLTSQSGVCAICYRPETVAIKGKIVSLAVDHCHLTNRVRGLLCKKCNNALGLLEDSPDRLRAAAAYLEKT
jgi:hypothetical protein